MHSFLIVGSIPQKRLAKVEELLLRKIEELKASPDFFLLQSEEGSIGIEKVRNLKDNLSLKPFREKEKIALIFEAQNLTVEAQNALLKTLEEPQQAKIYLTAPDTSWLLPTIVSRCQTYFLPLNSPLLDQKEVQNLTSAFYQIINSSLGEKLKILEKTGLTKDKTQARDWLFKLSLLTRELLLSCYQEQPKTNLSPQLLLKTLKLIYQYQKYLEANCQLGLTLENFLIEIDQLFSIKTSR